jgi:hypothetical protein
MRILTKTCACRRGSAFYPGVVPVLRTDVTTADVPRDEALLRWGIQPLQRSKHMNTIIYIVGLIVVVGFVLSFFGLR